MKVKIEIKHYLTGVVLFEFEKENNTLRDTVVEAVKYDADLGCANLGCANLRGADLWGAEGGELAKAQTIVAPPEGEIIGWKKCCDGIIAKLRIPAAAKRSNASGRKCRAEFVEVLDVIGSDVGLSKHDYGATRYVKGATVRCHEWDEDRWRECSGGIHFFITREEAEAYE